MPMFHFLVFIGRYWCCADIMHPYLKYLSGSNVSCLSLIAAGQSSYTETETAVSKKKKEKTSTKLKSDLLQFDYQWFLISSDWPLCRRRRGWQRSEQRELKPGRSGWRSWSDSRRRSAGFYSEICLLTCWKASDWLLHRPSQIWLIREQFKIFFQNKMCFLVLWGQRSLFL